MVASADKNLMYTVCLRTDKELYCNTERYSNCERVFEMVDEKKRSVGRSFRINEKNLDILFEEAEREGISLNSLVNKVFKDYCDYQRFFKRYSCIGLTQKSFSRIVEACPKGVLEEIAKKAGSVTALDIFRTMGLAFDFDGARYFISKVLADYAGWFKLEHYVMKDKEVFHMRHDLGENWSTYIAQVTSTLLEYCCNRKVKKDCLDGTVTLEVSMY
jgi:hypothetical protein